MNHRRATLLDHPRVIAGLIALVLAIIFAALNTDKVKVNWILGTASSPLILVIAVAFVLGIAAGALIDRTMRR